MRGISFVVTISLLTGACKPSKEKQCAEAGQLFEKVIVQKFESYAVEWKEKYPDKYERYGADARKKETTKGARLKQRFGAACADVPPDVLARSLECLRKPDMPQKYAPRDTMDCSHCDLSCVKTLAEVEDAFDKYVETRLPKEGKPKTQLTIATLGELAAMPPPAPAQQPPEGTSLRQLASMDAKARVDAARAKVGAPHAESGSVENGDYEARWYGIGEASCVAYFVKLDGASVGTGKERVGNDECWD